MAGPFSSFPIPLEAVNRLSEDEFVDAFGDMAEHSPWVAANAGEARPFASRETMIAAFLTAIREAGHERQRSLLLAHPDLAGRAAIAGKVTDDSRREQAGAGLDRLTADEFARFMRFNDAYRTRFGIPFIFAVRGATKDAVLAAFETRLKNTPDEEFAMALAQVGRIIRFRLEDRVSP
jgi:2-oxo-4-hydroxy-4-carboxy-5-ureidoimidazoline decarboxylase